jgi:hypothetical protein
VSHVWPAEHVDEILAEGFVDRYRFLRTLTACATC